MQELEEDPEIRSGINLYKGEAPFPLPFSHSHPSPLSFALSLLTAGAPAPRGMETDDEGEDLPEPGVDELIEELDDMNIGAE